MLEARKAERRLDEVMGRLDSFLERVAENVFKGPNDLRTTDLLAEFDSVQEAWTKALVDMQVHAEEALQKYNIYKYQFAMQIVSQLFLEAVPFQQQRMVMEFLRQYPEYSPPIPAED